MMKQVWLLGLVAAWVVPSPSLVVVVQADELLINPTCENSYSPNGLDRGILSWMHNIPGGFYNPKQEFRYSNPNDPTSLAGIFAKERIEEGELLCRVPWEYIITSPLDEMEREQLECPMIRVLSRELQLGKLSKFAPYVEYLNTQPLHQLPSVWSKEGQDLLLKVLGQTREQNGVEDPVPDQDLAALSFPPTGVVRWMDEWYDRCGGDPNDTWGRRAALMALLRADDFMMIPAYDFYNHRNGEWHNADTESEFGGYHETRAKRVIEEGEQIFISYNRCFDCGGRDEGYGASEILRDYGFVEPFPQHWHFLYYTAQELKEAKEVFAHHIEFDLDQKDGYYSVEWMYRPQEDKMRKSLDWMQKQIMRLTRLRFQESNNTLDVPKHEWDMTWAFHQANVVALKSAMLALRGHNQSIAEATTTSMNDLYHDLTVDDSWYAADTETPACDMPEYEPYTRIDGAMSFMRAIEIFAQGDDVCLDQNQKAHVCSSFRPGHFEYFVHPAASYLKTIDRVLIIANGASFLLHEVLKYNVGYALVLESDQTMTHMAQKHFGVDPHLNDPRIEWWFSDPGEVLTLVDHWGSFDLVLIDVPDSTFEGLFRNGGDLGKLVNRDGIVVSNKSHMQQFSKSFSFTGRLAYKLTPKCTRVITCGSHSIDFARAPVVDHYVETLLFQPSMMEENRFLLLQDFKSDDTTPRSVSDLPSVTLNDTWGMIQVLELSGSEASEVKGSIQESLTEHDFEVQSTVELDSSFMMRMKEGYIMARQNGAYAGLDVHFSTDLPKMSPLVRTLVQKLGPVLSSYRLVTNGREQGGRHDAGSTKSSSKLLPRNDAILGDILSELKSLMLSRPKIGLVFCESTQDCPSRDTLKELGIMETVLAVEICPNIDGNMREDVLMEAMVACEGRLQEWIHKALIENQLYMDAIILDGSLTFRSLQLVDAVLNVDDTARDSWISDHSVLLALPTQLATSEARRFVTNQFHNVRRMGRQDVPNGVTELVSKADFAIIKSQDETHRAEFSFVVSQGTRDIRDSFRTVEARLSEKLIKADLTVRIRELQAGPLELVKLLPPRWFQHSDYKNSVEQLDASSPTGAHALMQVLSRNGEPFVMREVVDDVTQALEVMDIEVLDEHDVEDTTILVLDRGEVIITIHHDEAMDLHLYLSCPEGDCPMSDFVDFAIPIRSHHPEWIILSLDILPRGPRNTIGFDNYSFVRERSEEDEDHDDDDEDEESE